jgi:NAD(P)H-hydrate epimerase
MLAARAAQSAGAGMVRLIVDPSLYPVLAPGSGGIMVAPDLPAETLPGKERFSPDAVLLGPGWGRGPDRARLLEKNLPLEEKGVPLILDADAIALARDVVFHGNALITPHPGEFAQYTGLSTEEICADPLPILLRYAAEKKVHILLKGHVLYLVSPQGRTGIIDGMNPTLASGGTGDALAGFCAAIAGRMYAADKRPGSFDAYSCAAAAAALLMEAGKAKNVSGRFTDPMELARAARIIAGKAWLPGGW